MVAKAYKVASKAHMHEFFDDLTPKMMHVSRVALYCPMYAWDDITVALLHDTIESGKVSIKKLNKKGFTLEVVSAVAKLSRGSDESYAEYMQDILDSKDRLVVMTKIRDLYDKLITVPLRNIEMTDKDRKDLVKYQSYWLKLNEIAENNGWIVNNRN